VSRDALGGALDALRAEVGPPPSRELVRPVDLSPVPQFSRYASVAPGGGLTLAQDDRGGTLQAMAATGTLFAVVDALAENVSQVRWKLWRKARSGKPEDRVEVTSHAFLDLMANPNPFMTGQELREVGGQHFELIGETWLLVTLVGGMPVELWPARPDRMVPVTHPTKFLSGYVYVGPDGERIPLDVDEVEMIRRPHPYDPVRGIGAVQSILADIRSAQYSATWNANFFLNSAEPGGIIEIDPTVGKLSDPDFNRLRDRWNSQHKGLSKAHRVAVLEQAKWVDRKITQKDMQFTELRGVTRDVIREAFRFPKSLTGTTDDVNRAVAEAMDASYGKRLLVPRLERVKAAYNNLLRRFPTARDLEYDYVSPVEDDREADRRDLQVRATAAQVLIKSGFAHEDVCAAVGLPVMAVREIEPAPLTRESIELVARLRAELTAAQSPAAIAAPVYPARAREVIVLNRPAPYAHGERGPEPIATPHGPPADAPTLARRYVPRAEVTPELAQLQANWERALDDVSADWETNVLPAQYDEAVMRVRDAIDAGDLAALATLAVSSTAAAGILLDAMSVLGAEATIQAGHEAVTAGAIAATEAPIVPAPVEHYEAMATVVAAALAGGVALSAIGAAVRFAGPGVSGELVAERVRGHLDSLTDAQPRLWLGGALTMAQNRARLAAFRVLPEATYYASEENDRNTCGPCDRIDKKLLGSLDEAEELYPNGGYRKCDGGIRCRGTFVAKWTVGA
jgi:HK97 family phage portal protein